MTFGAAAEQREAGQYCVESARPDFRVPLGVPAAGVAVEVREFIFSTGHAKR